MVLPPAVVCVIYCTQNVSNSQTERLTAVRGNHFETYLVEQHLIWEGKEIDVGEAMLSRLFLLFPSSDKSFEQWAYLLAAHVPNPWIHILYEPWGYLYAIVVNFITRLSLSHRNIIYIVAEGLSWIGFRIVRTQVISFLVNEVPTQVIVIPNVDGTSICHSVPFHKSTEVAKDPLYTVSVN